MEQIFTNIDVPTMIMAVLVAFLLFFVLGKVLRLLVWATGTGHKAFKLVFYLLLIAFVYCLIFRPYELNYYMYAFMEAVKTRLNNILHT